MNVLFAVVLLAGGLTQAPSDIFHNGNIYTLEDERPRVTALAVAPGGIIQAAGGDADMRRLAGPQTRLHDLGGHTVLPGLIDAHGHLAGLGSYGLGLLDLSGAKSYDDLIRTVADRVAQAKPGEWILGGRWDHESWPGRALPVHAALSAISQKNPVWLSRVDGHAGLANAAAMQAAGISGVTASPAGGEIIRDPAGAPTGVFIDNAMNLIDAHAPPLATDAEAQLLKAQELCLSVGLTGVHDMGVSAAEIDLYRRLAEDGRLKLRVYAVIHGALAMAYFDQREPLITNRLTVRACKLYADGALGSRGAWLLAPYADRPTDEQGRDYSGLAVSSPAFIRQVSAHAAAKGYQVCTHAIGDRGNRETLDAYAAAQRDAPARDYRFRVEHVQVLAPADVPRFQELGVIASMQPTHCTSDMRWAEARLGPQRVRGAYAWQSLREANARLAFGSDFPVESHNPFLGIYAAITRQDASGNPPDGWYPDQRLTRDQALRAFTLGAAYAAFEEAQKGSLRPGKLADFVVIDRDVLSCPPRDVRETQVLKTVIGGEVVYERR